MKNSLTSAEVNLAHQLLLGREVESKKLARELSKLGTLEELRRLIVSSAEFKTKLLPLLFPTGSRWVAVDVMDRFTQWIDLHDRYVSNGCFNNDWEPNETAYFVSRLNAGDTVLDIGANIGWFTLLAAKHTGRKGTIHAFEPRPDTARMLKRTISDNDLRPQVTVWDYALSDAWQKVDLVWGKDEDNPGHTFFAGNSGNPSEKLGSVQVTAGPLDEILPDIAPDLIKIDIEGAEPLAMQGAQRAIRRKRPAIISELYPDCLKLVSGVSAAQYIDQLAGWGYSCYLLEDGSPTRRLYDFPPDATKELVSVVFECAGPLR